MPVGDARRYPDFIILHPGHGLLFLEVKDWKLSSIQSMNHQTFTLVTEMGVVNKPNPIEQALQCAYQVVNKRDKALAQPEGKHKGSLVCPYGYGVVFTNISRKQLQAALGEDGERLEERSDFRQICKSINGNHRRLSRLKTMRREARRREPAISCSDPRSIFNC